MDPNGVNWKAAFTSCVLQNSSPEWYKAQFSCIFLPCHIESGADLMRC